ncbi:pRL2-11 [Streptomyces sp. N35]|uniref:pRL2-11 n=1 Tax=Streptomyces sp. N35 TaxID=2795730 RepID=UPI0018F6DE7F|nr:pRL2-11 [Streptomyces sp. N35]
MAVGQSAVDKEIEEAVGSAVAGVGRFLSGREMDGRRRTDATFFTPGRRVLELEADDSGRAARQQLLGVWSYLPYWKRAGIRLGSLAALSGGTYGYVQDPHLAQAVLQYGGPAVAGTVAVGGVVHAVRGREQRELMREWVVPLHQTIAPLLGIPEATNPRRYLHVPVDFNGDDGLIRVDLPVRMDFNKQEVEAKIREKLALTGFSFTWDGRGRAPYLVAQKVAKPPSKVVYADQAVRELVAKSKESAPLIGLNRQGKPVSVDLDTESPHVLVSAGTGGGKSVILRGIASQLIRNGARAYILDFKRVSHQWARGVPNTKYCRDIEDIHDALVALGVEGRRRILAAEELGDDADPAAIGPRIVILLEEINATMKQLTRYWEKNKEKGDPKDSPAVDALAEILFMGRAVRLNVLLVAQSATARALGGPEMRENFATRILARYTQNAWRMLVPEVAPAPKSTRHVGRAQVVLGGVAHETQVMFMTDAEARAHAMAGPHTPEPVSSDAPATTPPAATPNVAAEARVDLGKDPASQPHRQPHSLTASPVYLGKQPVSLTASQGITDNLPAGCEAASQPSQPHATPPTKPPAHPEEAGQHGPGEPPRLLTPAAPPTSTGPAAQPAPGPATADGEELLGLRAIQEKHLPGITLAALRRARADDPEFPPGVEKRGAEMLYRASDLIRWERNRPRNPIRTIEDDPDAP